VCTELQIVYCLHQTLWAV